MYIYIWILPCPFQQDGIYFLPLLTDTDIAEVPDMFSAAPLVDMSDPSQRYEEQYYNLAETPIKWLEALKRGKPILNRFCCVSVQSCPFVRTICFNQS